MIRNSQIRIQALGRQWLLDYSQNLEALWEAMDAADFEDERIPYWAELWPASLGLAQWLGKVPIAGQICLDLGCGLGFTAMIGQYLGARVLAFDYSLEALKAAKLNCRLNGSPEPQFLAMDWRRPALAPHSIAYAFAGDILYEQRAFAPVLDLLDHSLQTAGKAWLAEPGRGIFRNFQVLAQERGWLLQKVFSLAVPSIPSRHQMLTTSIWEATKK